ncbi:Fc.00g113530.m01.CDS01 [Cosmosporella sp. VM-42]
MARNLRSKNRASSSVPDSQPPGKPQSSRGVRDTGSSDEDDEGIPATSAPRESPSKKASTKQSRVPQHNLRSRGGDGLRATVPAKKRRAGITWPSNARSKRRRPNGKKKDEEGAGEELQDDQSEGGQDDESAPTNPDFWDGIRAAVNAGAARVQGSPELGSASVVAKEEGRLESETEKAKLREDRTSHYSVDAELEGGSQSQEGSRRKKRRQSRRNAYGEEGYQAPRAGSPELDTVSPSKKKTPSKKPQPQAGVVNDQQATARGPSKTWEAELSSNEDTDEEQGEGAESATSDTEQPEEQAEEEPRNAGEGDLSQMVADDSIFVAPPPDTEELLTIKLNCAYLNSLLHHMRMRGWTHEGKDWVQELLIQEDETEESWLKRQRNYVGRSLCRDLLKRLVRLRDHCHEMPRAPDFRAQCEYLRTHDVALRRLSGHIRKLVADICTKMLADTEPPANDQADSDCDYRVWAQKAVKDLYKRIIPLLILILREAFLFGGTLHKANEDKLPVKEYEFTSSTLAILIRAMGWTQRLFNAMKAELEAHPLKPMTSAEEEVLRIATSRRMKTEGPLRNLGKSFGRAINQLDQLATAPQEKKEAEERDKAIRAERERQEREHWQDEERKMQRFVQSTQRMAQGVMRFHHRASQPSSWESRPNPREHRPHRDEYFERHGGWYYWEDDRLLNMVRKVLRPNVGELVKLVPHRSARELEERVKSLKDRMRMKYEISNMEPPLWCYHHV